MAVYSLARVSPTYVVVAVLALFIFRRLVFELTTGRRRRKIIREYGCQEPYRYPHQGILGKLFGWDTIKARMKNGKEGRLLESNRIRNFKNGIKTLKVRSISRDGE